MSIQILKRLKRNFQNINTIQKIIVLKIAELNIRIRSKNLIISGISAKVKFLKALAFHLVYLKTK